MALDLNRLESAARAVIDEVAVMKPAYDWFNAEMLEDAGFGETDALFAAEASPAVVLALIQLVRARAAEPGETGERNDPAIPSAGERNPASGEAASRLHRALAEAPR